MVRRLKDRTAGEEGFTLIELMVVVLIIGILVAIALPTFLGARTRAQDRAAQSNLRNAAASADVWFTDDDTYTGFDATAAGGVEPALTWTDETDITAMNDGDVGVAYADDNEVVLIALSASGKGYCFAKQVNSLGTASAPGNYQKSEDPAASTITDASECEALAGGW